MFGYVKFMCGMRGILWCFSFINFSREDCGVGGYKFVGLVLVVAKS